MNKLAANSSNLGIDSEKRGVYCAVVEGTAFFLRSWPPLCVFGCEQFQTTSSFDRSLIFALADSTRRFRCPPPTCCAGCLSSPICATMIGPRLAGCLSRHVFAKDVLLFHKGSFTQGLYLIRSGAVRFFVHSETDQEITLGVYGQGECFVRRPSSMATSVRSAQCPWKGQLSTHFGAMISCVPGLPPTVSRRVIALLDHGWNTLPFQPKIF